MAEALYPSDIPPGPSSHKRTFDDMDPELDRPAASGSRRDSSVGSTSSTLTSRERNKRARSDNDSSYSSEVDDILLSSETSVFSSSSASSLSGYHSARSSFPAASPPLLPADEDTANQPPALAIPSPLSYLSGEVLDVPMEDNTLSFVPLSPIPSTAPVPQATARDSNDQFRLTMERVDAFDREMAALRQSPSRPPQPSWHTWTTHLPGAPNENRFASRSSPNDDPLPTPTHNVHVADPSQPRRAESVSINVHHHLPSEQQHASNSSLYSSSATPLEAPVVPRQLPPSPYFQPADERRRRLSQYERDAARHGDAVGRSRARQELLDNLLRDPLGPTGPEPSRHPTAPEAATSTNSRPRLHPRFARYLAISSGSVSANAPTNHPSPQPAPTAPPFPAFHPLVDDYWRREHDRDILEFDRTIREAEVHRQRIASFLVDTATRTSGNRSTRDRAHATASSASSTFSTLSGALDDSAGRDHARLPSSRRTTRPSTRSELGSLFDDPLSLNDSMHSLGAETVVLDSMEWSWEESRPTLYPRNFGLPTPRSPAPRPSVAVDTLDYLSFDPVPSPRDDSTLNLHPRFESYLESNSRARYVDLSSLRHRAFPRPLSPPSPRPRSIEPSFSYRNDHADQTERNVDAFAHLRALDDPHTLADHALLGSYAEQSESMSSADRAPMPPSPVLASAPLPDTPPRPTAYSFDLDAYREGPFRATLARSMALQTEWQPQARTARERERDRDRDRDRDRRRAEPRTAAVAAGERTRRDILAEESSSSEEEVSDSFIRAARWRSVSTHNTAPRLAQSNPLPPPHAAPVGFTRDIERLRGVRERERPRFGPLGPRSEAGTNVNAPNAFSARRPVSTVMRQGRNDNPSPQASVDRTERPDRRRESSSTAVPPSTAHRTLLDRARSTNNSRTAHHDNDSPAFSARASGLERLEYRRDAIRRMNFYSRGGTGDLASSSPSTAAPANPSPPSGRGVQHEPLSSSSLRARALGGRAYRPPSPPTGYLFGESRLEQQRVSPLNGRFARSRGLTPHMPPDVVLLDLPGGGRIHPHMRRRTFGDYMRDEDIDMSYEGLLSLSALLGDAKPRGTPSDIVSSLPRGTYGEWVQPGQTEIRCPICLDDYEAKDACLRIPGCSHWFHEGCLQQWLKGARTCPVCRGRVNKPRSSETPAPVAGPSGSNGHNNDNNNNRGDDDDDDDSDRDGDRTPRHWTPFRPPWRHD